MANARTRFDALSEYLVRNRDAQHGTLFGKPCLTLENDPFMMQTSSGVAFRLHGRALSQALTLKGACGFDPLKPDEPPPGRPGWVLVPAAHSLSWDRLAMDAMRCAQQARNQNVSWQPAAPPLPAPAAPPGSSSASLSDRAANVLKSGFSFNLAKN